MIMHSDYQSIIDTLEQQLQMVRANNANPAMVENIKVEAYNSTMSLQELASISVPEPQQLLIQPWDHAVVQAIEKALRESDMDVNPVVDGEVIRITFAPMTEEKRRDMVKLMSEKVENARVAVRKVREAALKAYKQQEKDGEIGEDDYFAQEKAIQADVDAANTRIEEMAKAKEDALMKV